MRWLALMVLVACGGEERRTEPVERSSEAEPVANEGEPASATDTEGAAWLGLIRTLRVDMRVGRSVSERGTPIEEVEAAIREAGGALDCGDIGWISDEAGVMEGQCIGSIPIEGGMVVANFRRYELPGEPTEAGLLNLSFGGPFLGNDDAIERWLDAAGGKLAPHFGEPENAGDSDAADLRWRAEDRYLVLHDPRRVPCGGECNAFLWIGGPDDPTLGLRGFE
jgi:hypothetical protein